MTSKKFLFITPRIFFVASFVVVLLIFAYSFGFEDIKLGKTSDSCEYGFLPKESFLKTYIVKEGETLLSIAKNELGSTSRVNELIELNKDKYPYLSIQNGFIEVGYTLHLPPEQITNSSGKIFAFNGNLSEKTDRAWRISLGDGLTYSIYPTGSTIFKTKTSDDYKISDCIEVIADRDGNRPFIVSPQ